MNADPLAVECVLHYEGLDVYVQQDQLRLDFIDDRREWIALGLEALTLWLDIQRAIWGADR